MEEAKYRLYNYGEDLKYINKYSKALKQLFFLL